MPEPGADAGALVVLAVATGTEASENVSVAVSARTILAGAATELAVLPARFKNRTKPRSADSVLLPLFPQGQL
jgi:hypothetical protein